MKKTNIILLYIVLTSQLAVGQIQQATTSDGKKIILNTDGTWKYAEAPKDSAQKALRAECEMLFSSYTDKFSGHTTLTGKKEVIVLNDADRKGFGIGLMKTYNGSLILTIHAEGGGNCINEGSGIHFLFNDGTKLELKGEGDYNCKKEATVYFDNTAVKKKAIEQLKSSKIKALRVWTDDSYVQYDFSKQNQDEFIALLNCLVN